MNSRTRTLEHDAKLQAALAAHREKPGVPLEELCEAGLLPELRKLIDQERFAEGCEPAARKVIPLPEIPGYSDLTEIARGGMGVVYKARQTRMNRVVALKVILAGQYANPSEIIRFLQEAEAVAAIDHPNVVKVFDTGDALGCPYLAMEYLPGGTLAERLKNPGPFQQTLQLGANPEAKCRTPMPVRAAAELIRKLALAVQAAHERDIVHRDLKPGNILFDAAGEPRITDFGLAKKASGADLTNTNAIMGTAAYMAPEQAKGDSKYAGPGADVWALGVMLFECLSGAKPFSGPHDFDVIQKVVNDPPSSLRSHVREIPRDLELIALKCLSKVPGERYATAKALAEDLSNWLEDKPISLKPAGVVERSVKWVKRNKLPSAVMAASVVAAVVMGGLAVWAIGERTRADERAAAAIRAEALAAEKAREAQEQSRRADEEATRAKVTGELTLFVRDLFTVSDPTGLTGSGLLPAGQGGRSITAEQLLTQGASILKTRFQGGSVSDKLTRASLLAVVGDVHRAIGLMDDARPLLEEALAIRESLLPADHEDILASRTQLANWHAERGHFQEAEKRYQANLQSLARLNRLETPAAATEMVRLSVLYSSIGDDRGIGWARKGLAIRKNHYGSGHRETAIAHLVLATNLYETSSQAANRETQAGLRILQDIKSIEHDKTLQAVIKYQIGLTMYRGGFPETAIRSLEESAALLKASLGAGHIYTTVILHDLGEAYLDSGRPEKADELWAECLGIVRRTAGLDHPRAINLINSVARRHAAKGESEKGLALYREALDRIESQHGKAAPWRLRVLAEAIVYCEKNKRPDEAKEHFAAAVSMLNDPSLPLRGNDIRRFVKLLGKRKDSAAHEAMRGFFHRALAPDRLAAEPESEYALRMLHVIYLHGAGEFARAVEQAERIRTLWTEPLFQDLIESDDKVFVLICQMKGHWSRGEQDAAERTLRQTLEEAKRAPWQNRSDAWDLAAHWAIHRGKPAEARAAMREFVKISELNDVDRAWGHCILALLVPDDAERKVIEAYLSRTVKSTDSDVPMYRARAAAAIGFRAAEHADHLRKAIAANTKDLNLRFALMVIGNRLQSEAIIGEGLQPVNRDGLNAFGKLRFDYYTAVKGHLSKPDADGVAKQKEAIRQALDALPANDAATSGYRLSVILELQNIVKQQ